MDTNPLNRATSFYDFSSPNDEEAAPNRSQGEQLNDNNYGTTAAGSGNGTASGGATASTNGVTNNGYNPLNRATSFYDFSSPNNGESDFVKGSAPVGGTMVHPAITRQGTASTGNGGAASEANGANGSTVATGNGVTPSGTNRGGATYLTADDNPYAKETIKNYEDMERIIRERMNAIPEETKEDREKRERREKHTGFLARLADGLGSFHTTFSYARGEKPMDMPHMTRRAEELFEKNKAQREKNRDQRMNYAINIANLGNDKVKALREIAAEQEKQRLARAKNDREEETQGWLREMQPEKLKEQKGKATKAEQEAITATEEAKNAPELYKAKVTTEKARGTAQRAAADAHHAAAVNSYASADAHHAAAGKSRAETKKTQQESGQGFPWWDEKGNMHLAKTKDEAIYRQSQSGGPIKETSTGGKSHTTTTAPVVHNGRVVKDKNKRPVTKTTTTDTQKHSYVPMKPGVDKKKTGVNWVK